MSKIETEVMSWLEKAKPIKEIADDYAKILGILKEQPTEENAEAAGLLTVIMITRVMYEYGYMPIFEKGAIIGYGSKELDEMN